MLKKPKSLQYSPFTFWLISHGRALKNSIKALREKPIAFFITAITLAVIITLPVTLYALLANFQQMTQQINSKPGISLYLKNHVTPAKIDSLIKEIQKYPQVSVVNYISPQQGLEDFKQYSEFSGVIPLLEHNPLPGVINITFSSLSLKKKAMDSLLNTLKQSPLVDQVSADITWIQRLQYSLSIAKRITLTLTLLLAVAMILVISNTVRLTAQAHHQETGILSLIGAARDYIRRPFLYHGLIYGCCGGLIAWILSHIILLWLTPPLLRLMESYGQTMPLASGHGLRGLLILGAAIFLSITGSWLATRSLSMKKRPIA